MSSQLLIPTNIYGRAAASIRDGESTDSSSSVADLRRYESAGLRRGLLRHSPSGADDAGSGGILPGSVAGSYWGMAYLWLSAISGAVNWRISMVPCRR